MEYQIITYGGAETLNYLFNTMALLLNSKSGTIYQPLVRLGMVVGTFGILGYLVSGKNSEIFKNWVLPSYFILSLVFVPTTTVFIKDPSRIQETYKVDNVPWLLGAFAGTISKMSHSITLAIEGTMALPDDVKYHKTGSLMASNLIADMAKYRITNTDVLDNMREFVNQCVIYDAMIGNKYTINELRNSSNIWELIKENPSNLRGFLYKEKGESSQILTCKEGVRKFEGILNSEVHNTYLSFSKKLLGPGNRRLEMVNVHLKTLLPGALSYMTDMAQDAMEVMKQQMMIHAVVDSVEHKSVSLGNAPNFAARRAYLQQRAHQETVSVIAGKKLLAMKNVMEALVYGVFIFILPLSLIPMGWRYVGRWMSLVLWVHLWPPIYAILNLVMNVTAKSKTIDFLAGAGGITIANSIGLSDLHADMTAQAGFMTMAVGSLAYALTRGGSSAMVHMASHISSSSISAASRTSEDLISGNYSLGNVSMNTMQANNNTFGQSNWSPSYASGAINLNDGDVAITNTSDGQNIINQASSNLRSSINWSENLSHSFAASASKSEQVAENKMVASSLSQGESYRSAMDFAAHQSKNSSNSAAYTSNESSQIQQAYQENMAIAGKFASIQGISVDDAVSRLTSVSAGAALSTEGIPLIGKIVKADVGGRISKNDSETTTNNKATTHTLDFAKSHGYSENLQKIEAYSKSLNTTQMDDIGKKYVDSINRSSDQAHQLRDEASINYQSAKNYQEMSTWTKQNGTQLTRNMNQEYVDWLQKSYGLHETSAILGDTTRDGLHAQAFLEQRQGQMQQIFKSNLSDQYNQNKNSIDEGRTITPSSDPSQMAQQQGVSASFDFNRGPNQLIKENLGNMTSKIDDMKESLELIDKNRKEIIASN